eukprot:m.264590 g.264590  ORF g.264590 m.264590 type:complete len:66 (-) comp15618_c0_seq8:1607-1804(-)
MLSTNITLSKRTAKTGCMAMIDRQHKETSAVATVSVRAHCEETKKQLNFKANQRLNTMLLWVAQR